MIPPFSVFYLRFNDEVGNSSRSKGTNHQEMGYVTEFVAAFAFAGNY